MTATTPETKSPETKSPETKSVDKTGKKPRKPRTGLSSVTTAMRLLKTFSESERELGVSQLAGKLDVAKSTVHRLAVTLVAEGMLEQNPENEKYRLSLELFHLGTLVRQRMNMPNEARPFLFDLRDKTHETVLLAVPAFPNVLYVYNLESPQAVSVKSELGVMKPAFCTALGRAMLAYQTEDVLKRVFAERLLPRTPRTIVEQSALRDLLTDVIGKGYAIDDEESEAGMRCIAAPVWNAADEVIGAVGVAGPVQRLSLQGMKQLVTPLKEATRGISERLGHHLTYLS